MKKQISVQALTRVSLLAALAVVLSLLEGLLSPVLPPGVRVGVANTVVMFAAANVGLPAAVAIALFKAAFALLSRGVVSFAMSLAGGISSAILLWILFRFSTKFLGVFGISMAGALCHNLAQLAVSLALYGRVILAYAPLLLLFAIPSGLLTAALLRASAALMDGIAQKYRKDKTQP